MYTPWLLKEAKDRIVEYLEENVFCPDFQEEYACYLRKTPIWRKTRKDVRQYKTIVYLGEYQFSDGLIVEHQVYDIPLELSERKDCPEQKHYMCIVKLPDSAVYSGVYCLKRDRGTQTYNAIYADRIAQAK